MVNEQDTMETDLPAPILVILAHTGKRRSFLRDEPVRNVIRGGLAGIQFAVNLTSYRSLPLSCLEGLLLKIDGEDIDVSDARLLLYGYEHRFADLSGLSHLWWFILDPGAIFVPHARLLSPGSHRFDATLITVEPYITAGRFSFYHGDRRELTVADERSADK
jgi:hypothetical protein